MKITYKTVKPINVQQGIAVVEAAADEGVNQRIRRL